MVVRYQMIMADIVTGNQRVSQIMRNGDEDADIELAGTIRADARS